MQSVNKKYFIYPGYEKEAEQQKVKEILDCR